MFRKLMIFTMLCVLGAAFTGYVQAQEEGEPDYTSGIVKSVSSASITIAESDSEEETESTFAVDSNTIMENFTSMGDIAVGDEVYIDFVVNAQGKAAVNIYKMGLMEDADDTAIIEETTEETPEENAAVEPAEPAEAAQE